MDPRIVALCRRFKTNPGNILFLAIAVAWLPRWYALLCLSLTITDLFIAAVSSPAPVCNAPQWKVVIIGAGFGGLCMAKRLKEVNMNNFIVLERNKSFGGTWFANKYPGILCDIWSHLYSYSFFPNPRWSQSVSPGKEIWEYIKRFIEEFKLGSHLKFNQDVTRVQWSNEKKMWTIHTASGDMFKANFVVSAIGILRKPYYPKFKNQELFKNPILHTANWDETIKLADKNVAIIGTGASAVQVVSCITNKVRNLYLFQRTPPWTIPQFLHRYPEWMKNLFQMFPGLLMAFRNFLYLTFELIFFNVISVGFSRRSWTQNIVRKFMFKSLGENEELAEKAIPRYELGCKRMTFSDQYLKRISEENAHLIVDPIKEFKEKGIVTQDGKEYPADVIILATGFDILGSMKCVEQINREGKSQNDVWGDFPTSYLGCVDRGLPNYFFMVGPGTILGHSSIIFMIECQTNYILDCIRKLAEENAKTSDVKAMEVRQEVKSKYMEAYKKDISKTVWVSGCTAWYQNEEGFPWTVWPRSTIQYWWSTYSCQKDDFEFF